jgi:glycosyltransferase involved in cell wall biosynthesis
VGQKPHSRLESLRNLPNVILTGWVPEVHPFLQSTDVYVAPLRMGSGTRLKLLEAMAAGCAVVATQQAAAGLPDDVRAILTLADDAKSMAQAVIKLLENRIQRQKLGQAAQVAVEAHYDWSIIMPRLLDAYKEIGLG